MADTEYKSFFKKKLADAGYKSPKDIPPSKKDDFFDEIDREWKGEKTPERDEPGNSNESSHSNTRAGSLLKNHYVIEDFYKTSKGDVHRSRMSNGMNNVRSRPGRESGSTGTFGYAD